MNVSDTTLLIVAITLYKLSSLLVGCFLGYLGYKLWLLSASGVMEHIT